MAIESFYVKRGIGRERATVAADGSGGQNTTRTTTYFDGVIMPVSSQANVTAQQLADRSTHILYCAATVELNMATDRILYGGEHYRITGRPVNPGNRGHHFEVPLELLT